MSIHAHLFSTRRLHVPIELEIVDDSEPERIEIQKSLRKRPRTSTENLQSQSTHHNSNNHIDRIPVIEISDSDSQSSNSPSKNTRKRDARTQVRVQPTAMDSDDRIFRGLKPSSASTSHTQLPAAIHRQIPSQRHPSEDEPIKGSSKPNLDHFLFKSSRMPRNLQGSIEPAHTMSNALPSDNSKGPKQKHLQHNVLASDVAKISRCICCNVQWTARKSGVQKMTHIQSCAKKHAFDDVTVNILIQKEMSPKEPFVKQTFFEDILGDAAPKQKVKRRKKEESSLKTISVSRNSILAQAQGILSTSIDDCKYQNGSTLACSTRGHNQLPSTQSFGRSDLALAQTSECNTFSLDDRYPDISDDVASSDEGAPEAQSAFLTSCLAPRPLKVFGDYESFRKGTQSARYSSGDESGVESNYINLKRLSPSSVEGKVTCTRVPEASTLNNSSKVLSAFTNLTIQSPTLTLKSKTARKATDCLNASSRSDEPYLSSDRVSPKKKLEPSKKTSGKIAHQFDEEWQLHMMRNIMLNNDLHLRILRYEPVHFDVFLEIAIRYAPPSSKLKRHLRMYLDDQAITFYGEAATRK